EEEMQELLDYNFEFILVSIAADGLDKSWLNKVITGNDLEKLKELNKKMGLNIAGEGGEFESLVMDCPLFKKKLVIEEFEIKEENECTARLIVKKARLE
ncbi:MAG: TIGR00289 family protein, partial [Nanoarchaeota archaeon]|nr:TIGR00289 family protein [Nanoarchaeota archaeon]